MLIDTISARFDVSAKLYSSTAGVSGAIQTNISRNLSDLALDALYTRVFLASELVSLTKTFDDFPTVELNGAALDGDDKQPLTINAIHGFCVQVLANKDVDGEDEPIAGYITVTVTEIGSGAGTPSVRHMVAGDDLLNTTVGGWPAETLSSIAITGTSDLADCLVVFALFGSSAGTAGGYGA